MRSTVRVGPARRGADDAADAARCQDAHALVDHGRHARGIDGVVDPRPGEPHDLRHRIDRAGVDHLPRAQFPGELQPRPVQVDGDDPAAGNEVGGHDGADPDRSEAEHGERLAWLHPKRIHHGAGARLDTAGERSEQVERRLARHLDDIRLMAQRVAGKGGLAEDIAVDRLPSRDRPLEPSRRHSEEIA